MPDPNLPTHRSTGGRAVNRPVRVSARLTELDHAHAVVNELGGLAFVGFGSVDASVELLGPADLVRRLLLDALAAVDALATG